jgi:hypothetical protein
MNSPETPSFFCKFKKGTFQAEVFSSLAQAEYESKRLRGLNPQSPEVIDLRRDPGRGSKRLTQQQPRPKD